MLHTTKYRGRHIECTMRKASTANAREGTHNKQRKETAKGDIEFVRKKKGKEHAVHVAVGCLEIILQLDSHDRRRMPVSHLGLGSFECRAIHRASSGICPVKPSSCPPRCNCRLMRVVGVSTAAGPHRCFPPRLAQVRFPDRCTSEWLPHLESWARETLWNIFAAVSGSSFPCGPTARGCPGGWAGRPR